MSNRVHRLNSMSLAVIGGALLIAGTAQAGNGKSYGSKFRPAYTTGHAPAAVEYARVVAVEPLVQRVSVQVPVRECYESYATAPAGGHGSTVVPTVAGGVVGGLIGDRFGGGSGRDAMRMLGVLVGASIGHDSAVRRQQYAGGTVSYPVSECTTRYENRIDERVTGYNVTYDYHGRRYMTRTDHHPGNRIPVSVDVRPAW